MCVLSVFGLHGNKWEEEAFSFGKEQNLYAETLRQCVSLEDLGDADFDSDEARSQLERGDFSKNDVAEFITSQEHKSNNLNKRNFDLNEGFLNKEPEIDENGNLLFWESGLFFSNKTCIQSGDPFLIEVNRDLLVSIEKKTVQKKFKSCKGHKHSEKHHKHSSVKNRKKQWEKELSSDRQVKDFSVNISGGSGLSRYTVEKKWKHIDDSSSCTSFEIRNKPFVEYVEKDKWTYDNDAYADLFNSADGTLFQHSCVDAIKSKKIGNRDVERPCWREKLVFLYSHPERNECASLQALNCTLENKICLEESAFGCALWKKTFKCREKENKVAISGLNFSSGIIPTNDLSLPEEELRSSFADVSIKLSVFSEIQSELQENMVDARDASIFSGKKHQCSKNVLDGAMYDCCFRFHGVARDVGLTKCSAEEIALAELRENGQCHYVGKFSEKFLNMWKSRDVHTFCCFPSKLSRIFQEQSREQLGIDFGTAKEPNCEGLSPELIAKVDFNKLDLRELYEEKLGNTQGDIETRLSNFQVRLEDIQAKMNKESLDR